MCIVHECYSCLQLLQLQAPVLTFPQAIKHSFFIVLIRYLHRAPFNLLAAYHSSSEEGALGHHRVPLYNNLCSMTRQRNVHKDFSCDTSHIAHVTWPWSALLQSVTCPMHQICTGWQGAARAERGAVAGFDQKVAFSCSNKEVAMDLCLIHSLLHYWAWDSSLFSFRT